jgi:hypothetical protein
MRRVGGFGFQPALSPPWVSSSNSESETRAVQTNLGGSQR